MAANAIISSLLLIALNKYDTSGDIIFKVNNAHVIKNPITYHGIFILPFLTSDISSSTISWLVFCFIWPRTNITPTNSYNFEYRS